MEDRGPVVPCLDETPTDVLSVIEDPNLPKDTRTRNDASVLEIIISPKRCEPHWVPPIVNHMTELENTTEEGIVDEAR